MKAVVGLLLIFTGFAIDYLVIVNKLPTQQEVSNVQSGATDLPTVSGTSTNFAASTGQGRQTTAGTQGSTGTSVNYNGPRVGGPF